MGMRRSGVSGHNTIGYRELSELQGNSEIFTKDKMRGWGARGMKVVGGIGNHQIDYGGVPELQMSKIREK